MEGILHKTLTLNGLSLHVAYAGPPHGSLILFIHGFPECWYTWRHQLLFFADRGFRVLAPDLRGYADTTAAPPALSDPSKFTSLHVVGDLVALIDAESPSPGDKVFVVGHDWGAMMAWALCLYRPDKIKALVNMSVAFSRRNPSRKPIETLRAVYGPDYYICRFQEPGEIEREFAEIGTKNVLKHLLTYRNPAPLCLPKGKPFPDGPVALPAWLREQDLDYYADKYDTTGFTGPLNYYRAIDLNWELTAAWTGATVNKAVPVKFIVGDLDLTYNAPGVKDYINKGGMKKDVPYLKDIVVMEGVAHFLHEERPVEINDHILSFFNSYCSAHCASL